MRMLALFLTFLRIGCLAWGGPVAQINMLREELVEQQGWIPRDRFTRVLALYQALPGPEAFELCVYFGMIRRGRLGGILAGLGFMLPGLLLMLVLAYAYTSIGPTELLPLFVGIVPAVAALIVRATHRIGGHVLNSGSLWAAGLISAVLTLLGVHFALVLLLSGMWQSLWLKGLKKLAVIVCSTLSVLAVAVQLTVPEVALPFSGGLFLEGLKAGLLSFGGAYTAIPFLQNSMVGTYPAITPQAFLDGIALGNIIPAPLVIFGTFLGWLADRLPGALLMTAGIFLPAFSFTLLGHNHLERAVENKALHSWLDGISAGVVGILGVSAASLLVQSLGQIWQVLFFVGALSALYRWKARFTTPAIIIGCGTLGHILTQFLHQ